VRGKRLGLSGWGRAPRATVEAWRPEKPDEVRAVLDRGRPTIVHAGGRSYGDQALNDGGEVLLTGRLDRFVAFDGDSGLLVVEPGVTFRDILRVFGPRGWQVPVSPGTGFATIGGAVANDVHGKNHDRKGSFGDHVAWVDLMLPGGTVRRIDRAGEPRLFQATVGGMGLTGVILAVAFSLVRVPSDAIDLTERRMPDLDAFMAGLAAARETATYSVGWIDALAKGGQLGRGILETGEPAAVRLDRPSPKRRRVPLDFPSFALNPLSIRLFNMAYYARVPAAGRQRRVPVESFLYPLDALIDWNRIYGRPGFHQFQCVIPDEEAPLGMRRLLEAVSAAGAASFLAVLKTLGGEGLGMLSFPRRGFTLALDFPRRPATVELLGRLERITLDHGGRIYLAKDAVTSAGGLARMYPRLDEFRAVLAEIDPEGRMTSDMSRRLQIRPAA
jgi:decaprenylphospho-beta-D-ribofuranose 2-oxidase